MNVVEPPLDRRFIVDCCACRRGKGVHAAVARYHAWANRYRYALKMDVRQYFPSVDHALLKDMPAERIKDTRTLALLGAVSDTSPDVPSEAVWFAGDDLFKPLERRRGDSDRQPVPGRFGGARR